MKKINSREIKYLNAYGPYEHGIWNSQNGSLVANLQLAGSMLFFQRSIELVEQISSSLLGIFTRKELKIKLFAILVVMTVGFYIC